MNYFRDAASNEVGGWADEGQGKLALITSTQAKHPSFRSACRDGNHAIDEQQLFAHLLQTIQSAGYSFSRTLVAEYYVSLKTNPFVILTGNTGRGKTEFVQLFAEALIGSNSSQYALIGGSSTWHHDTGEGQYYRSLHERFCSWRFLEVLQEAGYPENVGKVYLVCFDALHPDELEYYFATLLRVTPDGQKRLNLPGFPPDEQPVVPPNLYITATVNLAEWGDGLSPQVLCHAGLIEFRAPLRLAPACVPSPVAPPPVGYQRLWLHTTVANVEMARGQILQLLGSDQLSRLRCSPQLSQLLWRAGEVLTTQTLHDLTTYIAHSFDAQGRGLFDPHDRWHNAQIAFDAQVVQRVLWRLRNSPDDVLRRDLTTYLDSVAGVERKQAVA